MKAFGKAMLDSLNGNPKTFIMKINNHPIQEDCTVFSEIREDEKRVLKSVVREGKINVLDYGCGIGRHFDYLLELNPNIICHGIEKCELLNDYLREKYPKQHSFYLDYLDILEELRFDAILFMGNGLGVLGDENAAKARIQDIVQNRLNDNGHILFETGNPFGRGYITKRIIIQYNDIVDEPIPWGYADFEWVKKVFEENGCEIEKKPSFGTGGCWFFAISKKRNA